MRLTPGYHEVTLTADGETTIHDMGRVLTILEIEGASTAHFGIGGETPRELPGRLSIGSPNSPIFDRVTIVNNNAVTVVVRIAISSLEVADNLTEFSEILDGLEDLSPADSMTMPTRKTVAQDGVGVTTIAAANADRKQILVTADLLNTGYVFLSGSASATSALSFFDMLAGGSWREQYRGAVYGCSQNGTERVRVYELE